MESKQYQIIIVNEYLLTDHSGIEMLSKTTPPASRPPLLTEP